MNTKENSGITLVALIITIIILLILAGVSINFISGNEGIFSKAQSAVDKYKTAQNEELEQIAKISNLINNRDVDVSDELVNAIITKLQQQNVVSSVPAGTVISYITGNDAPPGYLKCDGSVYNIADYPNLAKAILDGFDKYDYWGGDGETTFAVPNLQGEFLRGTGTNSHTNQGNGASVGTHQDATEFPSITYNSAVPQWQFDAASYSDMENGIAKYDTVFGTRAVQSRVGVSQASISGGVSPKKTSRPTNTSVLYCIKY